MFYFSEKNFHPNLGGPGRFAIGEGFLRVAGWVTSQGQASTAFETLFGKVLSDEKDSGRPKGTCKMQEVSCQALKDFLKVVEVKRD